MGKKSSIPMPDLGLLGVFGSVNTCTSDDKGFFCQLSRFTSSVIMILMLVFIVYFAYQMLYIYGFFKKSNKGWFGGR